MTDPIFEEFLDIQQHAGRKGSFQIVADLYYHSPDQIEGTFKLAKILLFDNTLNDLGISQDIDDVLSFLGSKKQVTHHTQKVQTRSSQEKLHDFLAPLLQGTTEHKDPAITNIRTLLVEVFKEHCNYPFNVTHHIPEEDDVCPPKLEPEIASRNLKQQLSPFYKEKALLFFKTNLLGVLCDPFNSSPSDDAIQTMHWIGENLTGGAKIVAKAEDVIQKVKTFSAMRLDDHSYKDSVALALDISK